MKMHVEIHTTAPGDAGAGIADQTWTIPAIDLAADEDREAVRGAFRAAFETLVGSHVDVRFSDEDPAP